MEEMQLWVSVFYKIFSYSERKEDSFKAFMF